MKLITINNTLFLLTLFYFFVGIFSICLGYNRRDLYYISAGNTLLILSYFLELSRKHIV